MRSSSSSSSSGSRYAYAALLHEGARRRPVRIARAQKEDDIHGSRVGKPQAPSSSRIRSHAPTPFRSVRPKQPEITRAYSPAIISRTDRHRAIAAIILSSNRRASLSSPRLISRASLLHERDRYRNTRAPSDSSPSVSSYNSAPLHREETCQLRFVVVRSLDYCTTVVCICEEHQRAERWASGVHATPFVSGILAPLSGRSRPRGKPTNSPRGRCFRLLARCNCEGGCWRLQMY